MKAIYKYLFVFVIAGLMYSCEAPTIDVPAPSAGTTDFSSYLAIGNSLTAGYADNGLYFEAQSLSYPSIIAQQMTQINPDLVFNQPTISENGSGYLKLKKLDLANLLFEFEQVPADPNWTDKIPGSYQNMGIPGIRVKDITFNGYGANLEQGNPYFYRILGAEEASKSYLDKIGEEDASFYTSWLGNNDILGYATSGGAAGTDGAPGTGLGGITPESEFTQSYDALINTLNGKSASGLLVTVPDILKIPFFTSVAWNALVFTAEQAEQANAAYAAMIDPTLEATVQAGVIALVVTEQAVIDFVIPDLAQGTVYQQAYAGAIAGGASDAEAAAAAEAYVASPEGQAAISALITDLNADLRNHLTGAPLTKPELSPLYDVVDEQLATNTTLQAGIAQGIEDTTAAYEAGLLPPDQQALLAGTIDAQTASTIAQLQAAGFYPTFEEGPNGFVAEVETTEINPLGIRQMVEGELVLFTAVSAGELNPDKAALPKPTDYILIHEELLEIDNARDTYNAHIKAYESGTIAVLDVDEILDKYLGGTTIDGVDVSGAFIQGGIFSLDAVHLTPRGYAIVANEMIAAINEAFGSSLPPVNINGYRPVVIP